MRGAVAAVTHGEWVRGATEALAAAGAGTPRLDAELLLADAAGLDRADLVTARDGPLASGVADRAGAHLARRRAREPVAYILGRRGFRRIELGVDPRVLVPRPETELLVEVALELSSGARVHEVGTGSGAVALALRDERPDLAVSASDRSARAAANARENARHLGFDLDVAERADIPAGAFDLVLANLPYVREDEWVGLAPEITAFEPREALVAGADGLDEIRALVASAASGQAVALEHAPGQATAVRALLHGAETRTDLAGRERVSLGVVP